MDDRINSKIELALHDLREHEEFPDILRGIANYIQQWKDYEAVSRYLILAAEEAEKIPRVEISENNIRHLHESV